jgi:hypothetical protein
MLQLLSSDEAGSALESLSLEQLAAVLRAARSSSMQRSQSVPDELAACVQQQ